MNGSATEWGWVIAAVAVGWNMINTVYTWYASGQSVTKQEIKTLMAETGAFGNRLTKIEADMRAMPSAAQFHELDKKVEKVSGAIETLDQKFKPTALSVSRIETFLLEGNLQIAPHKSRR